MYAHYSSKKSFPVACKLSEMHELKLIKSAEELEQRLKVIKGLDPAL